MGLMTESRVHVARVARPFTTDRSSSTDILPSRSVAQQRAAMQHTALRAQEHDTTSLPDRSVKVIATSSPTTSRAAAATAVVSTVVVARVALHTHVHTYAAVFVCVCVWRVMLNVLCILL